MYMPNPTADIHNKLTITVYACLQTMLLTFVFIVVSLSANVIWFVFINNGVCMCMYVFFLLCALFYHNSHMAGNPATLKAFEIAIHS